MLKQIYIIFITMSLCAFAQDDSDSTEVDPEEIFGDLDSLEFDSFDLDLGLSRSSVFLNLDMGQANPLYKGFSGPELDQITATLGWEKYKEDGDIKKYTAFGIFYSSFQNDMNLFGSDFNGDNFDGYTVGLMDSKGYGWDLGFTEIILGSETGYGWGKLGYNFDLDPLQIDPETNLPIPPNYTRYNDLQNTYREDNRYAEYFRAFTKIQFGEIISLDAGFERTIIFPRWLVFHQMVSGLTEGVAAGLTNQIIKRIKKKNENLVPILYFVMKNAVNFGFYQLRKDRMNWPINSAPALLIDTYKVGITLSI
jgi:hypothetical protein